MSTSTDNYIYFDGQFWRNYKTNCIISPTVGEIVDIVVSESGWKNSLNIMCLSSVPVFGSDDYVTVISSKHVKSQTKYVVRGFDRRPKSRGRR